VPSWFYLVVVAAGTFALACLVFALIVVVLNRERLLRQSEAAPVMEKEEE